MCTEISLFTDRYGTDHLVVSILEKSRCKTKSNCTTEE